MNAKQLQRKLNRMMKELVLTSTNEEAETKRGDIMEVIRKNKWANISIVGSKIIVA